MKSISITFVLISCAVLIWMLATGMDRTDPAVMVLIALGLVIPCRIARRSI